MYVNGEGYLIGKGFWCIGLIWTLKQCLENFRRFHSNHSTISQSEIRQGDQNRTDTTIVFPTGNRSIQRLLYMYVLDYDS